MTHKSVKCWLRGQVISFPFKAIRWNGGGGEGDEVHNRVITRKSFNVNLTAVLGSGGEGLQGDPTALQRAFSLGRRREWRIPLYWTFVLVLGYLLRI